VHFLSHGGNTFEISTFLLHTLATKIQKVIAAANLFNAQVLGYCGVQICIVSSLGNSKAVDG
jgi:hypothetical protein